MVQKLEYRALQSLVCRPPVHLNLAVGYLYGWTKRCYRSEIFEAIVDHRQLTLVDNPS